MVEDAKLLRRYATEKSEEAFAALVQRHLDLVYSAALRRLGGDAHAAADVAQQVFTALARQAPALARGVVLPGWLYATTRNVAVDFIRTEQRRRAREQEAQTMQELISPPAPAIAWEQLRPVLDAAMDELGGRDREAVLLRFFSRRPFAEIGSALRVSEDAARMRVERALAKLHALLTRRGVTSTSAALAAALTEQAAIAAPAGLAASVAGEAVISVSVAAGSAAASGSSVGALAGFIHFMSASKLSIGIVGLVLIVTLGGALHEIRAGQLIESAVAAAKLENEKLAARLRTRSQQGATATAAMTTVRSAALRGPLPQSVVARNQRETETNAYLARHPELRDALRRELRATVAGRYGSFFRAHQLSPIQIERFLDLAGPMFGMGYRFVGTNGASLQYGPPNSERAAARKELQAMLGEDGFRDLTTLFEAGLQVIKIPTELAGALYYTPTPLTAEQADRLQRILRDRQVRPDPTSPMGLDWNAIVSDAAEILTEPQMMMLKQLRTQEETYQALYTTW